MNQYSTLEKAFIKRITPIFFISIIVIVLIIQYIQMTSFYSALEEKQKRELQRITFEIKHPLWNLSYGQLDEIAEIVILDRDTVGILILDEMGEIIISKGVESNLFEQFLAKGEAYNLESVYTPSILTFHQIIFKNTSFAKHFVDSKEIYFKTDSDALLIGSVYLLFSDESIRSSIRNELIRLLVISLFVFIFLTLFVFISYHFIVTAPLRELYNSINDASNSFDFTNSHSSTSINEIVNIKNIFDELWEKQSVLSQELKDSKNYYHQLLEQLPLGVLLSDQMGKLVFYNKAFLDITGYKDDDIKKLDIWKIIPKKYHFIEGIIRRNPIESDLNSPLDEELIGKTGDTIPVSVKRNILTKDNEMLYLSSIEDIRHRIATQKNLEQNENFLNETAAIAKIGGWELNIVNETLYWTKEVYKIHEVESSYAPDLESAVQFYHPDDRATVTEAIFSSLKDGKDFEFESRFITAEGRHLWVYAQGKPVVENNKIIGVKGTFQDITSRKESEKEKMELQRQVFHMNKVEMLGQLAGGIAHDFNNLLTPIMGYVELVISNLSPNTKSHEYLGRVLSAASRASELIKQILTFSHINDIDLKPLQAQIIIKEVLKLFRVSVPIYIEVDQKIDMECGLILADPTHIHQILMNLCTNSYHAMEGMKKGKINISYNSVMFSKEDKSELQITPGSYACLSVEDTGSGMEQEVINRIFEPYFTTKEKKKGTGLGLAITHKIISDYGGYISVKSEKNIGTTINIYIPIVDDQGSNNPIVTEKMPLETGLEHILVIDDEFSVAEMEKDMIENLGYKATMKIGSKEGLEYFKNNSQSIDLVITDMTMPDMTGDILAKEIMSINDNVPIIIITGYSDIFSENDAKKIGIKDYLLKPISMEKLSKSIRRALNIIT